MARTNTRWQDCQGTRLGPGMLVGVPRTTHWGLLLWIKERKDPCGLTSRWLTTAVLLDGTVHVARLTPNGLLCLSRRPA
jgi:hypothetical protein